MLFFSVLFGWDLYFRSMHLEELNKIAAQLDQAEAPIKSQEAKNAVAALEAAIRKVEASWSGSWLGYHARVYYEELQVPPEGAKFSKEWGLLTGEVVDGSVGAWCKYRRHDVLDAIWLQAGKPDLAAIRQASIAAAAAFENSRARLQPLVTSILARQGKEDVLTGLAGKIADMKIMREENFIQAWSPKVIPPTEDLIAMEEGVQAPPHITLKAEIWVIRHPFMLCGDLAKTIRWLTSHLEKLRKQREAAKRAAAEKAVAIDNQPVPSICIGHGKSAVWKDLRNFIHDVLQIESGEFNRVPVAGLTNTARLAELLRLSAFAVLVLTREEEESEGITRAMMTVLHHAGLFQGRLGLGRAVVLLEDGCADLGSIDGLAQMRFPAGNVAAVFDDLRTLLEQEKLIAG